MRLIQKRLDREQLELNFAFDDTKVHEIEVYDLISKTSQQFTVSSKLNYVLPCTKESKQVRIVVYQDGEKAFYLKTRLCPTIEEEEVFEDMLIGFEDISKQANHFYSEIKEQWGERHD